MNDLDTLAFTSLFGAACEKCFGYPLRESLNETESKLLYNKIFDQTGLVVGWKSLKNYSLFIIEGPGVKAENPSIATLDTLARYVDNAPYSSETERKDKESHYPYWFGYKEKFHRSVRLNTAPVKLHLRMPILLTSVLIISATLIFLLTRTKNSEGPGGFTDHFQDLSMNGLEQRGWFLQFPDTVFWSRRHESANQLTLFTLRGDNWPDSKEKPGVRNLLLRKIQHDCFETELRFGDFIPNQRWQQAGILLLEDTNFNGKSIRMSLAYNDFFAGHRNPKEIFIQIITSLGKNYGEPEELAHYPIEFPDSMKIHPELANIFSSSYLKIEKQGKKFRFLYAGGSFSNPAFKEITAQEFEMQPRYIGIFAIRGFTDSTNNIPVHFSFFRIKENNCD